MEWLKERFLSNMNRHPDISWDQVESLLEKDSDARESLEWMEQTGGMPDVLQKDDHQIVFVDFSNEEPAGRRSVCYDEQARLARKKNAPGDSAMALAARHGLTLLDEEDYRALQESGNFDLKTSCWLLTPDDIRSRGGALFGEKRYGHIFIYHNGADSYYQVRGFRCKLILPLSEKGNA